MLSCLKACIRHPKEKRNKARPSEKQEKPDTVVPTPVFLSHGNAAITTLGENVALERVAPIVDEEEASQVEEEVKAEETEDESEEEVQVKVMGMTEESAVHAELASATIPKERKFQVVRVPGVFTRGRWKCWDYRDDVKPIEGLTFTDDKENDSAGTVTVTASTSTVSEQAATNHSPLREESSTIVVTSIAPAPPTPQHGTPSSISEMPTPPFTITEVHHHHPTTGDWIPSTPTTVTITSSQPPSTDTVVVQSVAPPASAPMTLVGATPITPTASIVYDPPTTAAGAAALQQTPSSSMVVEEPRQAGDSAHHLMTTSVTSSEGMGGGGVPSSSSVSPPSVSTTTPSPEMTRSGSEAAPAPPAGVATVDEEPAAVVQQVGNAAAIDNKIEQAMDLVKTHLTFAVREEVEILRTTIAELENRVTTLETQNAYLKRHVTPEVLASLPGMVQQHKMSLPATAAPVHLQQVVAPSAVSAPSSSVSPALAAAAHQQHEAALRSVVEAAAEAVAAGTSIPAHSRAAAAAAATAAAANCPVTTNFVNSLNTVVYPPQPPPSNPR